MMAVAESPQITMQSVIGDTGQEGGDGAGRAGVASKAETL
jgi:hypothetical protein